MTIRLIVRLSTVLIALLLVFLGGVSAYGLYRLTMTPINRLPTELRLPSVQAVTGATGPYVAPTTTLEKGEGTPSLIPGRWPCFRGERFDAINHESIPLIRKFSDPVNPETALETTRKTTREPDVPAVGDPGIAVPGIAASDTDAHGTDAPDISPEVRRRIRWGVDMGEGFAGPAVYDGCVYVLDYDMERRRDALRCLSFDDGREIWRYSYPVVVKKNHGMSRSIPAVSGRFCVSIGPMLHTACVDRITGEEIWFLDVKHRFGVTEPEWYSGQCPLVVRNPELNNGRETLILAVGSPATEPSVSDAVSDVAADAASDAVSDPVGEGDGADVPERNVLLLALDCETGRELWRTPNPFGWTMTHASIMPMTLDGRETYVYCGKGGVLGVDGRDGRILWSSPDWMIQIATCPSPVVLPENRVFFCGGYESGSVMMRIDKRQTEPGKSAEPGNAAATAYSATAYSATAYSATPYAATTLFRLKSPVFGSEQQTPIFHAGHLFGIRQRDKSLVCLTLDGKITWDTSRGKRRFGLGPYLLADGILFILDDEGVLTLCEATPREFRPLDEQTVLSHNGWAPMALVHGFLLLRDENRMICLDVRK
ncbi:MAG TPA: hypothetical protein DEB39_08560 [Planctomycetaceae bacterium]|nr:hypothetical protein [Planctomycetaceae bacterium]